MPFFSFSSGGEGANDWWVVRIWAVRGEGRRGEEGAKKGGRREGKKVRGGKGGAGVENELHSVSSQFQLKCKK